MKMAGMKPYTVEIEPGTVMRFWVPSETTLSNRTQNLKPAVVLLHGFAGDGLVTWAFQISTLAKNYSVYVLDLIFFGGSTTDRSNRSPSFQAECLAVGLKKLGMEKCVLVGFSYDGTVSFKMAELYSKLVRSVVVTGSVLAIQESLISRSLENVGFSSCLEMLLPSSVEGLKALLSVVVYKNIWFPNFLLNDFLKVCIFLVSLKFIKLLNKCIL